MEYWTTTLTISPHKDVKKILELGKKYNIPNNFSKFLSYDFRKNDGFARSVEYTKKNKIYRQTYCGCLYSENFL
jgi:predicted adenine nucleotide alpha hydrolase (AANH) superfamily ATPase